MRERDDLDQRLALARLGLSSTRDARARVGHRLAERGAFSAGRALATSPHGVPVLLSAVLMGVSFAGGYWLRDSQSSEGRRAVPSAVAQNSAAPPSSSLPAVSVSATPSFSPAFVAPSTPPAALRAELDTATADTRARSSTPVESKSRRLDATRPRHERSTLPSALHSTRPVAAPSTPATAAATASELALLRRAERAIRAGDPALAMILLDQLERAYPLSALGEERTAARILVECARSGDLAKPEARRFLEKHPSSMYSDRIARACQVEADRAAPPTDVPSNGH